MSLILGGAESNLWDLCRTYANLSSTLNYFTKHQAKYRTNEFTELNYKNDFKTDFGSETKQKNILGAGSIWLTYNAMEEVNRPEGDGAWKFYDSSLKLHGKREQVSGIVTHGLLELIPDMLSEFGLEMQQEKEDRL